jgi:hypothetical protein
MAIVLQGVFAFLIALIAIQCVGVIINEGRRRKFFVKPVVARGSYALAATSAFLLSFHEVSQVVTF